MSVSYRLISSDREVKGRGRRKERRRRGKASVPGVPSLQKQHGIQCILSSSIAQTLVFTPPLPDWKKKIIAYDDKLGRALTVHTVPTSLAPSQPWLRARTTITNTGCASQEGVGRPAPASKGGRERRAARWSRRDSRDKPG